MKHFIPFIMVLMLCGCSASKSINYLQDIERDSEIIALDLKEIKIKRGDKLSIIIKSKDARLADLFNLPIVAHRSEVMSPLRSTAIKRCRSIPWTMQER